MQVQERLEGGGELLEFEVAQGDDDLAGAVVATKDLHVPGPVGCRLRGSVLVGVQLVGADHPLEVEDAGLAALGQLDQGLVHVGVGAVQAGQGPHRRVRQAPLAEGLGHDRPALELVGDAQFLEGGGAGHVRSPHQPGHARELAVKGPHPSRSNSANCCSHAGFGPIHLGALLDQPLTRIHHATSSPPAIIHEEVVRARPRGATSILPEHPFEHVGLLGPDAGGLVEWSTF